MWQKHGGWRCRSVVLFWFFGLYRGIWRYASLA